MKEPEWLLDSTPREVQLEALRRSYYGYALKDHKDDEGVYREIGAPAQIGWGHFLEMRLGKTPLSINEFELFHRDYGVKNVVSVCPNTFKINWVEEAIAQGASVPWFAYESTNASASEIRKALKSETGIGLSINYEAMRTDRAKALLSEVMSQPTALILDESIKLKGHTSLQTKAVLNATKEAAYIRNLSGAPMTQGPQDLYGQFRSMRRISGTNFYAFRNKFCKMGGFKNKKIVGTRNEEELHHMLHKFGFVARRKEWANEIKESHYIEKIPFTDKQQKHYAELDKEFVTILDSGQEISADVVVAKMGKLQQISSGFVYHESQSIFFEDPNKLPKMERVKAMMEEATGKVVVCYHYSASGDALEDALAAYHPASIRGKQHMRKRGLDINSEKKRFNNDPQCRLILVQISAGKYGHDLSGVEGDRTDMMIFYENTWSLDDRTQVEMRNTTAFQDWAITRHDFASSPIEMSAIKALADKRNVSESVIDYYNHIKED